MDRRSRTRARTPGTRLALTTFGVCSTGLDPRDGTELRTSTSRASVAGLDLTFSAPKSVSVLFGLGDEETRSRVRGRT
ncbi:relaxase domain-containing protein [Solirubrobacter pauli]|uniref:relaxase domain-containing protein n=1 Tax=Solirubrobacter pauli TaxID=166793 RepID=UPI000EB57E6A